MEIPDLRLINLVQPNDVLAPGIRLFCPNPADALLVREGDPWTWVDQYPEGSRVVIQATAKTKDEALRLSDKLHAVCGRN